MHSSNAPSTYGWMTNHMRTTVTDTHLSFGASKYGIHCGHAGTTFKACTGKYEIFRTLSVMRMRMYVCYLSRYFLLVHCTNIMIQHFSQNNLTNKRHDYFKREEPSDRKNGRRGNPSCAASKSHCMCCTRYLPQLSRSPAMVCLCLACRFEVMGSCRYIARY
jgi:hypothetical protein